MARARGTHRPLGATSRIRQKSGIRGHGRDRFRRPSCRGVSPMRLIGRVTVVFLLLLGPAAGLAHAVTIPELVALSKEGLSDDILIALIQTDGSTFQLSATDLLQLHKQGLSNAVILAMQQTALKKPKPAPPL